MTATPDLFAWLVVIPLTIEALRRLPSAFRSSKGRTLWFVFVALDLSMATRIGIVSDSLYNFTGIDDAATLVKHLVGIAAVAGLLRWVTTVVPGIKDGQREPNYRRVISNRPRRIATWGAMIIITVIFPLSQRRTGLTEDADFIYLQAGHLWGSLHLILFYTYLTFGMVCAALMCAEMWRNPASTGPFKAGMLGMAFGCAVGSFYGILRGGYLLARLADRPFLGGDALVDVGSNLALILCVSMVLLGSAAPAWERLNGRMEAHAAVNDLRPMWSALTAAVPSVIYRDTAPPPAWIKRIQPRAPRLHRRLQEVHRSLYDFWNWTALDNRLRRRVNEICDASMKLQPYVPPRLREETQRTATALGLPSHTVPAYLLRTAMTRMNAGEQPYEGAPEEAILHPGEDPRQSTLTLLPIGSALTDSVTMSRLDRRLASTS